MKISVASDHRGFKTKRAVIARLVELQHEIRDVGTSDEMICDYCDFASTAAWAVSKQQVERAILICGTGIGMSIVANKFKGVRAALCCDDASAEVSRRHYDSNILCLPSDFVGQQMVLRIVEAWLTTSFAGGRHARRLAKIACLEIDPSDKCEMNKNGISTVNVRSEDFQID